ncbi:hypothetical protein RND71_031150 [Anisodus tanguticus]|uniref:Uncharacterized protein n=1 Tax=Anisodus tanguticus TaxID=243964 RepID=A0AAE1RA79_9SOLA|nr:hypothetical protein RND71_031150 [Anisodus tanguticus]
MLENNNGICLRGHIYLFFISMVRTPNIVEADLPDNVRRESNSDTMEKHGIRGCFRETLGSRQSIITIKASKADQLSKEQFSQLVQLLHQVKISQPEASFSEVNANSAGSFNEEATGTW